VVIISTRDEGAEIITITADSGLGPQLLGSDRVTKNHVNLTEMATLPLKIGTDRLEEPRDKSAGGGI